ncbi:hypothetical protein GOB86_10795 [Acetobacter lambici]|uniref:Transglycosylase SLT domain-containing protein n=1 Tax=Acetobacter lambici TaxID=1332824 RepID=A0ABT1F8D6_9PROT|nr:hypothetical protein [Acetobacter lambici]MCP1244032.1 hypothetical protein [Acetobacter lambici]MCP1260069.1 hypothetical protein [Acetobacter lambici]NHO57534.1 hypothetical protein [Acetobacter lambici]
MPGLDLGQFKALLVRPALEHMGLGGSAALNLLTGTALVESGLVWLRQNGGGPALGLWQMEPATHDDCWRNFLAFRPALATALRQLGGEGAGVGRADLLVGNLAYACAMARIVYARAPRVLPMPADSAGLSAYHKQFYNTPLGAADSQRNVALFAQAVAA